MFESLKSAIGGSSAGLDNDLILISETASTSANGLICHFLQSAVAGTHPVCLVTLQNTWGHYCNIGNKLGLNLRLQSEHGNVKVIDGLKLLSTVLDQSVESVSEHPFNFIVRNCENPLKNLYYKIKNIVLPWKEASKYFVIIMENITALLNMGVETNDIDIFIQYCRNLTGGCHSVKSGSLIVVTSADDRDDDANHLTNMVGHSASLHLAVRGLGTGQSREVHGDLRITAFDRKNVHQCSPNVQHFQYKMEEKNMKLFAPGTSANVL